MVGPMEASAGAITSANRTGVSKGTTSSRGVRALSASRRRVSVANADVVPVTVVCSRRIVGGVSVAVEADMDPPSGDGATSGGEGVAGEPEVYVVEGWGSGGRRGRGEADFANGAEHGVGRAAAHRDGQRRADREGVVACDPVAA